MTNARMKLARRTGLEGIRLNNARQSRASLMLKARAHPQAVQERLRHSSSIGKVLDIVPLYILILRLRLLI